MTITQTVEVPIDRCITLKIPPQVPAGKVILTFTPVVSTNTKLVADECPYCTKNRNPVTGNPNYNAETIAAIEEGIAISRGEMPAKRFNSLAEMLEDLERDSLDD